MIKLLTNIKVENTNAFFKLLFKKLGGKEFEERVFCDYLEKLCELK